MLMLGLGKPAAVYSTAAEVMSVEIYILLPSKINRPLVTLFLPWCPTGSQSKKSNCKKKTEQKRKMRKKTDKD